MEAEFSSTQAEATAKVRACFARTRPMKVIRNSVVALKYEVLDGNGEVVERGHEPIVYLHGGHGGIFPKVEEALADKAAGERLRVRPRARGRLRAARPGPRPRRAAEPVPRQDQGRHAGPGRGAPRRPQPPGELSRGQGRRERGDPRRQPSARRPDDRVPLHGARRAARRRRKRSRTATPTGRTGTTITRPDARTRREAGPPPGRAAPRGSRLRQLSRGYAAFARRSRNTYGMMPPCW